MMRALVFLALAFCLGATESLAGEPKLKLEEVLARHLDSIGPDGQRAGRARSLKGACELSAPTSGEVAGALRGTFTLVSSPAEFGLKMQFPSASYPAESFTRQGAEAEVGFVLPGRRSGLGSFLSSNAVVLRENLLGGTLNGSWPLLALAESGAKLRYDGLKKRDKRMLHQLGYRAKKGQFELDIFILLEPETYRHVMTIYKRSQAQGMASDPTTSSSMSDLYQQLEETFADFASVDGLTVPTSWTLRYENRGPQTLSWKYNLKVITPTE